MFADRATIVIRSGKGGDGHVSFRREKFVPDGGPDGGDGGKGGDVIFEVDEGMTTLSDYRHRRKYAAGNGEEGKKKRCHGKNGEDIVLKVPAGTVIRESKTGQVIADMSGDVKRKVILKGGRGGTGNMHYATSTMQAPKYARPGQDAKELEVLLELKLIADVGLVGYPNAGKSTLLSRVTNADPKIGSYPFTTIEPGLGVVDIGEGHGFVMADIPGIIEGASEGLGLGHEFLRHIDRTRVIVHLVDAAGSEGRDPAQDVRQIRSELAAWSEEITQRPCVLAANKLDLLAPEDREAAVSALREEFGDEKTRVIGISAATGEGLDDLINAVGEILSSLESEPVRYEQEYFPDEHLAPDRLPYTVQRDPGNPHIFIVEGPKIEKMLGYTNLESEKGFRFFQNFLKDTGILEELEALGITDGDTVRMYGHQFEYFKS